MPTHFRSYAPDQDLLLAPSLKDWLPTGHLAYFISDVIEELDISALYAPYEGDGRRKAPFEPRMMLKVLVYAYATGVFSSRKIARKLEEDIAFRVLGAGNFPRHRTLCDFRKRHLKDFQSLFVRVVQIAQEADLIRLGTIAIDGTKVRANASRHKAMSYARMQQEEQRLAQEIAELCVQAGTIDAAEDRRYGADQRAMSCLRNSSIARIVWKRSVRRKHDCSRSSATRMQPEADIRVMGASHREGVVPISAISAYQPRKRKATLPIPKAVS